MHVAVSKAFILSLLASNALAFRSGNDGNELEKKYVVSWLFPLFSFSLSNNRVRFTDVWTVQGSVSTLASRWAQLSAPLEARHHTEAQIAAKKAAAKGPKHIGRAVQAAGDESGAQENVVEDAAKGKKGKKGAKKVADAEVTKRDVLPEGDDEDLEAGELDSRSTGGAVDAQEDVVEDKAKGKKGKEGKKGTKGKKGGKKGTKKVAEDAQAAWDRVPFKSSWHCYCRVHSHSNLTLRLSVMKKATPCERWISVNFLYFLVVSLPYLVV